MKEICFRVKKPPIHNEDVIELERKFGFPLPTDYRTFLLSSNGGIVDERNEYFPIVDKKAREIFDGGFLLETFFGVKNVVYPPYELWKVFECFRGRIPADTISIANNAFGDMILLAVKGPDVGVVYVWDHEHEGLDGTRRKFQNIYKLTGSFAEFLDGLTETPPDF